MEEFIPFAPKPNDVICNRAVVFRPHPGNQFYRSLIEQYGPRLRHAHGPTPQEYNEMIKEILEVVLNHRQGRFLKVADSNRNVCKVMTQKEAEQKVKLALLKTRSANSAGDTSPKKARGKKAPKSFAMQGVSTTVKKINSHWGDDDDDDSIGVFTDDESNADHRKEDNDRVLATKSSAADARAKPRNKVGLSTNSSVIPFDPMQYDVICTKKQKWREHPGNVFYRRLLEKCLRKMDGAEVTELAEQFLKVIVHQRKARFLRPIEDEKFCVELTPQEVDTKVKCSFYTHPMYLNRNVSGVAAAAKKGPHRHASSAASDDDVDDNGDDDDDEESRDERTSFHEENDDDEYRNIATLPTYLTTSEDSPVEVPVTASTTIPFDSIPLYGSPEEEMKMRRWLNENELPQSVGNILLKHGARTVNDIKFMFQVQPGTIQGEVAFLDFVKLHRATR